MRQRAQLVVTVLALATLVAAAACQSLDSGAGEGPWTRAERSNYTETSRYDDVIAFLEQVASRSERISLTNRPGQNGPLGGMGQRPNAQGLDLNRDHMKVESPEARSLVGLLNAYDPHVGVDLHTTNGTRHAYHLTYSPPLNPNTHPAIDILLRGDWLPAVTEAIRAADGEEPLGRLAFYLLEPRSDDGLANWNVLDEVLEGATHFPIVRLAAQ